MKRMVSLVLALTMVLSLALVGAGAATYTDEKQVTSWEAVEVLNAIGVISGYPDGSFRPDGNVTRAEMAKMICYILNEGDDVGSLYAGANVFTDCGGHWAKGYIAFASQTGIVDGVGGGRFDPSGSVTGTQAAKMLLCALGYNAVYEGYTGNGWSVNVLNDAKDAGLLDDLTKADMSQPLSRDNAAQMIFNALEADMVKYAKGGTSIVTPDGTVVTTDASDAEKKTNQKDDDYRKSGGDTILQLCEEYFGDLKKRDDKKDDYGRPGHTWVWDGGDVGTYSDDYDEYLLLSASNETNGAVLVTDDDYFDLDVDDFADKIVVYINGDVQVDKGETYSDLATKKYFQAGDAIELFENGDDEIDTIVVTRYTLAKIDEIDTDLSSTYTKKGATRALELVDLDGQSVGRGTYYDAYQDHDDEVLAGFDAGAYVEDTVLAVVLRDDTNRILASVPAEVVNGQVKAYRSGDKASLRLGDDTYLLTGTLNETQKYTSKDFDFNATVYTAYADPNGYLIGIEEESNASIQDVYYVTGVIRDTDGMYSSNSYYAQAVLLSSGAVKEIRLETDSAVELIPGIKTAAANTLHEGSCAGLYTFTDSDGSKSDDAKSNNGKFWAEKYDDKSDSTYYVKGAGALGGDLSKGDSNLRIGGNKVYLNSATQYVKIEDVGDDIDVSTVTGGTSVRNSEDLRAVAICTKSGGSYTAAYVVLLSGKGNSFNSSSADDMVYVAEEPEYDNGDGWETELFFLDGTGRREVVTVDASSAPQPGFYSYSVDDDDIYSLEDKNKAADNIAEQIGNGGSYDDETGWALNAALSGVHNSQLSVSSYTYNGKTVSLEDVDLVDGAFLYDVRGKTERDEDGYKNEIKSVSQLRSAVEKDGWTVIADVYYDDGAVVLVCVTAMNPN